MSKKKSNGLTTTEQQADESARKENGVKKENGKVAKKEQISMDKPEKIQKKSTHLLACDLHLHKISYPVHKALSNIPSNTKIVDIASGVVNPYGMVELGEEWRKINAYMLREYKKERKTELFLTVGGAKTNFNFLKNRGHVNNFYVSLSRIIMDMGFDGFTLDVRLFSSDIRNEVIDAVKKFKKYCEEETLESIPMVAINALPTFVCPAVERIEEEWNHLVPIINELKDDIHHIKVMVYNYGKSYIPYKEKGIPIDNRQEMARYIFNSYVAPFNNSEVQYEGMNAKKIFLSTLVSEDNKTTDQITEDEINSVINKLNAEHTEGIGGLSIEAISNYKESNNEFSDDL